MMCCFEDAFVQFLIKINYKYCSLQKLTKKKKGGNLACLVIFLFTCREVPSVA